MSAKKPAFWIQVSGPVMSEVIRREGSPDRTVYKQSAGLFDPAKEWPSAFDLSLSDREGIPTGYQEGVKYTLTHSSFRFGKYGNLEIDPYNIQLTPISEEGAK